MNQNDSGWVSHGMQEATTIVQEEWTRPSVLFRPKVYRDGNAWCALYGNNLMEGVAAFGNTPDEATRRFDAVWISEHPSR